MNWSKILPYVLLVAVIVFGGYQFKQHQEVKADYQALDSKYDALKHNSKQEVQEDATKFIKAFYNYKDRPKRENIEGLATKEVQDTLFQTYEALDKEFERPKKIDYSSEAKDITIYHARDEYESKAKVLATLTSEITINKKKTHSNIIAELNLKLQDGQWIVTGYKTLEDVSEFQGS
ncbi:hypothetical protein ACU3L3_14350 [Priestia endophytica]|uniref:DUF3828 domain-containing protein n=1 Tax=Priestia endophytica DSM 13796 TaxID=1121089 RepID=A0A1I6BZZ4_9BACI|nr:hypothetical protein [Priestia endophytica]KYG33467.1 hypothetical protein AZF06_21725 [Priestia endophytica]SFQ86508.1 hypothetical protein SAMN02745910_04656 [Priestia endophytica DSM 13796]